jgi:hypothetical protein
MDFYWIMRSYISVDINLHCDSGKLKSYSTVLAYNGSKLISEKSPNVFVYSDSVVMAAM